MKPAIRLMNCSWGMRLEPQSIGFCNFPVVTMGKSDSELWENVPHRPIRGRSMTAAISRDNISTEHTTAKGAES
jgi:hypothetical protein